MQRTADFSDHITHTVAKQTDCVFDNPTALNATDDVLDQHSSPRNRTIFGFPFVREFLTTRFLVRLRDLHTSQGEAYKAEILQ